MHDGNIICNSAVIIQYLDETFPSPRLTPTEPELQQAMMHWIDLQDKFPMRELMYGNLKAFDRHIKQPFMQS